jgi:tRNA(fMet)-specific endonuclease VapC
VRVLLDTNVVSHLLRGDSTVATLLKHVTELVISVVVVGELLHGYRAGRRYEKNVAVLRKLLAQHFVELRDLNFAAAEGYGRIQRELQERGTPIPSNDIWIAAHSIEASAELWSYDRHFARVEGLRWRHLE